jgi:hypothetical protein
MKYPVFAICAVAAAMLSPAVAHAGVKKTHKVDHVAYHHSVRQAYGMYQPGGIQDPSRHWSDVNAAVDGNNANSMFGSDSANENAEGRTGG